jgi:N-acetylglucosaminyldiphosphoundecaprenol N-acetyl-beta-D-mannosaminyltransferase
MAASDYSTPVTSAMLGGLPMAANDRGATREVSGLPLSNTLDFCGVRYSPESLDQLYVSICRWLSAPDRSRSVAIGYLNPHVFNLAQKNQDLKTFLKEADIVSVDGVGVALGILLLKRRRTTRTVMTPLFDKVLASTEIPRLKALLIGGSPEVAAKGAMAMNAASPRIEIVETFHGYHSVEESLVFMGQHQGVDLVLIAMGSPHSEELMLAARRQFRGKTLWSIGGTTLHFYAGTQPRIPAMVSGLGFQWLWRIVHEPHVTPRYVIGTPAFGFHLLKHLVSRDKKKE